MSTPHGERPYSYHPNLRNAGAFRDNYDTAFGKPHWKCSAGVRNGMDDAKCWHCGEVKPEEKEGTWTTEP